MTSGGPVDAQHAGHGEAPHVGVDGGGVVAGLGQGDGQVGGDRRLPHPSLARRHGDAPGCGQWVKGLSRAPPAPAGRRRADRAACSASLIRHEVDGNRVHPGDAVDRRADQVAQLVAGGVIGAREPDGDPDGRRTDHRYGLHQLQFDERAAQLGVVDRAEGSEHVRLGWHGETTPQADFHYGASRITP